MIPKHDTTHRQLASPCLTQDLLQAQITWQHRQQQWPALWKAYWNPYQPDHPQVKWQIAPSTAQLKLLPQSQAAKTLPVDICFPLRSGTVTLVHYHPTRPGKSELRTFDVTGWTLRCRAQLKIHRLPQGETRRAFYALSLCFDDMNTMLDSWQWETPTPLSENPHFRSQCSTLLRQSLEQLRCNNSHYTFAYLPVDEKAATPPTLAVQSQNQTALLVLHTSTTAQRSDIEFSTMLANAPLLTPVYHVLCQRLQRPLAHTQFHPTQGLCQSWQQDKHHFHLSVSQRAPHTVEVRFTLEKELPPPQPAQDAAPLHSKLRWSFLLKGTGQQDRYNYRLQSLDLRDEDNRNKHSFYDGLFNALRRELHHALHMLQQQLALSTSLSTVETLTQALLTDLRCTQSHRSSKVTLSTLLLPPHTERDQGKILFQKRSHAQLLPC